MNLNSQSQYLLAMTHETDRNHLSRKFSPLQITINLET